MKKSYIKFAGMIATSTVAMFILMYINTFSMDHIFFSETRFYMALLMSAVMAIIMLSFMLHMLKNRTWNIVIVSVSLVVFGVSLFLVRDQTTIDDVSYMRAMIPHHSIAILTSGRARLTDPRVKELADDIIKAQVREIEEMKKLIEEIENED